MTAPANGASPDAGVGEAFCAGRAWATHKQNVAQRGSAVWTATRKLFVIVTANAGTRRLGYRRVPTSVLTTRLNTATLR